MTKLRFEVIATEGAARAATVHLPRGSFETPVFMPVGTRGAVKTLAADDLESLRAQIILGNTYHLMLRPGAELIASLGGLGSFSAFNGRTLTDSGGYQAFSLKAKMDDDGMTFASVYDGARVRLTPEVAVETQSLLGADIAMVLDVCAALPADHATLRAALERTLQWAERCQAAHQRDDQCLFGIVQGGTDLGLRAESAERTASLGFDGYAIGGLSVGETRAEMLPAITAATSSLPPDRPRYLMGVGDPVSLVEAVARGVDMFDCVLPTRLARHGTALTSSGKLQIRNAVHARSADPLDTECSCTVCARYSRGYLRHLLQVGETTGARLVTLHNLAFLLRLMQRARTAIIDGTFAAVRADTVARWGGLAE